MLLSTVSKRTQSRGKANLDIEAYGRCFAANIASVLTQVYLSMPLLQQWQDCGQPLLGHKKVGACSAEKDRVGDSRPSTLQDSHPYNNSLRSWCDTHHETRTQTQQRRINGCNGARGPSWLHKKRFDVGALCC